MQWRTQAGKNGGAKSKKIFFWGGKNKKIKQVGGKILILIFFFFGEKKNFGENFGAWGGQAPPSPNVGPPLLACATHTRHGGVWHTRIAAAVRELAGDDGGARGLCGWSWKGYNRSKI
jgi:hypothetical protein